MVFLEFVGGPAFAFLPFFLRSVSFLFSACIEISSLACFLTLLVGIIGSLMTDVSLLLLLFLSSRRLFLVFVHIHLLFFSRCSLLHFWESGVLFPGVLFDFLVSIFWIFIEYTHFILILIPISSSPLYFHCIYFILLLCTCVYCDVTRTLRHRPTSASSHIYACNRTSWPPRSSAFADCVLTFAPAPKLTVHVSHVSRLVFAPDPVHLRHRCVSSCLVQSCPASCLESCAVCCVFPLPQAPSSDRHSQTRSSVFSPSRFHAFR